MDMNLVNDGLMISVIGMGVVMIFLTFMMAFMNVTEVVMKKLNEICPEEIKEEPQKNVPQKTDEEIAVAIATMFKHKNLIKGGNN